MAFIDSTYLNNSFGSANVTALCPTADELNQSIASAESMVEAALILGGYSRREATSSVATTPEVVKLACYGQWLQLSHLRHSLDLKPQAWTWINLISSIRDGSIEIDGESRSSSRSVGGVSFADSSATTAGGSPQIFKRSRMSGY